MVLWQCILVNTMCVIWLFVNKTQVWTSFHCTLYFVFLALWRVNVRRCNETILHVIMWIDSKLIQTWRLCTHRQCLHVMACSPIWIHFYLHSWHECCCHLPHPCCGWVVIKLGRTKLEWHFIDFQQKIILLSTSTSKPLVSSLLMPPSDTSVQLRIINCISFPVTWPSPAFFIVQYGVQCNLC